MHSKRSLQHSSGKSFAKRASNKRLSVDQRQQSRVPRVRYLEFSGEGGKIARSKTSGLPTSHAKSKLTEQKANRRSRTLVMRPAKPVGNAILVLKGKNGISKTIYFGKQVTQGQSFKPPEISDAAEGLPFKLPKIPDAAEQHEEKVQEN